MNEKKETFSDIIREMRNNPFSWSVPSEIPGIEKCNCEAEKLADRIDAAVKREKAATEADALYVGAFVEATRHKPCNAAAMREALEELASWDAHCSDTELHKIASAALSAPPRNCDRFANIAEATDAWRRERRAWEWSDDDTADNYVRNRASADVLEIIDWLFAKAEGGAE